MSYFLYHVIALDVSTICTTLTNTDTFFSPTFCAGVAHGAYENDVVALKGMREIFDYLPLSNKDTPAPRPTHDSRHRIEESLRYVF